MLRIAMQKRSAWREAGIRLCSTAHKGAEVQDRRWALNGIGSAIRKTLAHIIIGLTVLVLSAGSLGRTQTATTPTSQEEDSSRIHQILQDAKSYQAADAKNRIELGEVLGRQIRTFAEFEKQCADLEKVLSESDAMETRKRKMLSDLQFEFRGDSKVQPIFDLLHKMEDESDKVEPIWRGMIACSGVLASAGQSQQEAYRTICVAPANQQLGLLAPELKRVARQLQTQLEELGGSLPPDFLQAIGQ